MTRTVSARSGAAGLTVLALLLTPLLVLTAPASGAVPAAATAASRDVTLEVEGDLVTVQVEGPGAHREHWLVLRDGTTLPVRPGALGELPVSGHFRGLLDVSAVPGQAPGRGFPVVRGSVTPRADVSRASSPVAHTVYVAAPTNLGAREPAGELASMVDEVGAWFEREGAPRVSSFDRVGAVVEYATTTTSVGEGCGLRGGTEMFDVLDEAADLFPGVDLDAPGRHLVVLLPRECMGTSTAGIATLGDAVASGGGVLSTTEGIGRFVLTHELAHNLGLGHANTRICGTVCGVLEYDDEYNVMGRGQTDAFTVPVLNTVQRQRWGVSPEAERTRVTLAGSAETLTTGVRLAPRSATSGLRAAAVDDPETGAQYVLEYRTGTGADAGALYMAPSDPWWQLGPGLAVLQRGPVRSSEAAVRREDSYDSPVFVPGTTFQNDSGSVQVEVLAMDATGLDLAVTLATGLPTVAPASPPEVLGDAQVGQIVEASAGPGWPSGTEHLVTWSLDGATMEDDAVLTDRQSSSFYVPPTAEGAVLRIDVVSRVPGARAVLQSTTVGTVGLAELEATRPRIRGLVAVGETVTADPGSWFPTPDFTFQWLDGGTPISGATSKKLTLGPADVGRDLSVRVTGEKSGWSTTVRESPSTQVAPGRLHGATPTITGKARVGRTLTAVPGRWTAGTALTYQWLANGKALKPGATGSTFKLKAAVRGKQISVRVTGRQEGYRTLKRTSSPTSKVR